MNKKIIIGIVVFFLSSITLFAFASNPEEETENTGDTEEKQEQEEQGTGEEEQEEEEEEGTGNENEENNNAPAVRVFTPRPVVVVEVPEVVNIAPVISLLGDSVIKVNQNNTFTDPGSEAFDVEDGDITVDIVVAGDVVDTSVVGDYVITYNVEDNEGLAATEVTRTVSVVDEEAPRLRIFLDGNYYETDGEFFNTKELAAVINDNNIGKFYINDIEYPQYESKGWFGLGWTLIEGEHTFKAVDMYDNSTELSFEIDLTKPVVKVYEDGTEIASGDYVDKNIKVQINANDKNIGKVYINGVEYPQYEGKSWYDIDWILRNTTVEENTVVLEDQAGNLSDEFIIKVDLTAPRLRIFLDGNYYETDGELFNTKDLSAVINDDNKGEFYINDVEYPQYEGKGWFGLGWTLIEGEHTFKAVDMYDNSTELSFEIDLTKPVVKVYEDGTEIASGDYVDKNIKVQINANDKNIGKVYINGVEYPQYEGKSWYNIDWILKNTTVEENTVVLEDQAGNLSDEFIIKVDLTEPRLRIFLDGNYYESDGMVFNTKDLAAVINDDNKGKFYINDVEYPQYEGKGWFGLGWTLTEGEHTFKAVDVYGNETELDFAIDMTAPTITLMKRSQEYPGEIIDPKGDGNWWEKRWIPGYTVSDNYFPEDELLVEKTIIEETVRERKRERIEGRRVWVVYDVTYATGVKYTATDPAKNSSDDDYIFRVFGFKIPVELSRTRVTMP